MKLLHILPACLMSFSVGIGIMYFYGYGVVLNDFVYRDDINSMKSHAFTLAMIRENKIDVATQFLEDAIKIDKERLSNIPEKELSEESKQQLLMLNSMYEHLDKLVEE